jgi:hypothetical protein
MIRQDLRPESELKMSLGAFGNVRLATTPVQPGEREGKTTTPAG